MSAYPKALSHTAIGVSVAHPINESLCHPPAMAAAHRSGIPAVPSPGCPATTRRALVDAGISLEELSCGYTIDHPRFGEILTPIFDAATKRLIKDLLQSHAGRDEIVASTMIPIARARYTISVTSVGDRPHFGVSAPSVFEQSHDDVMNRTVKYLKGRLALQISPSMLTQKALGCINVNGVDASPGG